MFNLFDAKFHVVGAQKYELKIEWPFKVLVSLFLQENNECEWMLNMYLNCFP